MSGSRLTPGPPVNEGRRPCRSHELQLVMNYASRPASAQLPLLASPLVRLLIFYLLPALAYALMLTDGTLNFFREERWWRAYNELALSLLSGRLDVPAWAIREEGFYYDHGVYMYFGLLPALLRMPLAAFVDLRTTPVADLMIWAQAVAGAALLQNALLKIHDANRPGTGGFGLLLLVLASASVWFASGSFILVQNGSIYNEPIASALLLICAFIRLLASDHIIGPPRHSLLLYAAIAALCVHARPTMAVGLYAATLVLLADWRTLPVRPASVMGAAMPLFRRAFLPLLVLFIGGAAFLTLNWLRFGGVSAWDFRQYGFYIAVGDTPRFQTVFDHGEFNLLRLLPYAASYATGLPGIAWHGSHLLGLGFVPAYKPIGATLLAWAIPLVLAAVGLASLLRRRRDATAQRLLMLAAALSVSALLVLCYVSLWYRYNVDFWPVVALLMLIGFAAADPAPSRRRLLAGLGTMALFVSVAHNLWVGERNDRNHDSWAMGDYRVPLPERLVSRVRQIEASQRARGIAPTPAPAGVVVAAPSGKAG